MRVMNMKKALIFAYLNLGLNISIKLTEILINISVIFCTLHGRLKRLFKKSFLAGGR